MLTGPARLGRMSSTYTIASYSHFPANRYSASSTGLSPESPSRERAPRKPRMLSATAPAPMVSGWAAPSSTPSANPSPAACPARMRREASSSATTSRSGASAPSPSPTRRRK